MKTYWIKDNANSASFVRGKGYTVEELKQITGVFNEKILIEQILLVFDEYDTINGIGMIDTLDVDVGAFVVGLSLSFLTGFLIVPFIVAQQAWALWFADSYNGVIILGVIAWFATVVFGIGVLLCFMAKTYQDNAYKDGTISYRIRNFRFLNMIPKVYKQPWYVILLEYYRSIKEKTCKKIEFED